MNKYTYTFKKTNVSRKKKRKVNRKLYQFTLIFLINIVFVSSFVSIQAASFLRDRIDKVENVGATLSDIPLATELYDRNGELLFRMYGDESNTDRANIEEINNSTIAAFLAAEDSTFYEHDGSSEEAIIRCASRALSAEDICGGSTITQQVVKITTKRNEPTVERKIDELIYAHSLEENYSKNEILEQYFNVTPYGSNITGIKTASKLYFNIEDLSKLSLAQSVALASIINDPTELSPVLSKDKELATKRLEIREEYVFNQLETKLNSINNQIVQNKSNETPLLTFDEIQQAKDEVVAFEEPSVEIKAGHFVNYALDILQERVYLGDQPLTLADLQTGGYRIYTSLDYKLQKTAERYAWTGGTDYQRFNVYNAALMTTIPSTGEIITMAGSKSFTGKSEGCDGNGENCKYDPEVNVLDTKQSPGSTNKTLAYYMAYEQGLFAPGSFLPDIPITFGGYRPKNWDSRFLGANYNTTARNMLRDSRNMPALIIMDMIGHGNYINKAKEFGYTTYEDESQYGVSLVLGGGDVLLTEQAQGYGVFANQGNLVELNPIKRIENSNGDVLYEAVPEPKRVGDPAASHLLNQSLMNLPTGTGDTISWDGREVAGKTGTTENNRDSLLVTYSPDFVTVAWSGNNSNEPMNQVWGWPGFITAPWVKNYHNEIGNSEYLNNRTSFSRPENVYYGGGFCTNNRTICYGIQQDWLIAGNEPTTRNYRLADPKFQSFLSLWYARRDSDENSTN